MGSVAGSAADADADAATTGPLRAFHYVLWLLLNGGMWNSGDRILWGRFEMCGMWGWWKLTWW